VLSFPSRVVGTRVYAKDDIFFYDKDYKFGKDGKGESQNIQIYIFANDF
jgi:hypothetical protein